MSALIAPLLRELVSLSQARELKWEATAAEDSYVASRATPGGVVVLELAMGPNFDADGDFVGAGPALYIRRAGREGDERKMPVSPEDTQDYGLLGELWRLASSAETREFLEDVLRDFGLKPEAPPQEPLDPFGDR